MVIDAKIYQHLVRASCILAIVLGIGARVIDIGDTPPGLNQDEASIGYEAWSLLHYGIDRHGASWPVHLISWGDGQNVLYAYIAMPFVAFGLSPLTTRLPMLFSALASLWLIWFIAGRLFGQKAAWSAAAVAALSPWHIMLARWGLESNLLPFMFLCGFACLIVAQNASRKTAWLVAACALFGLCLYAYGTAYLSVPLFVLVAILIAVNNRTFTPRHALIGVFAFAIVALPIALFVAVNTFGWSTLTAGDVTIPRLPMRPRFQGMLAAGPMAHIGQFWDVLLTQRDGTLYNVTDPYGVLYSVVLFVLAIGLATATIVLTWRRRWPTQCALIAVWVIACVPTGLLQEPNINRINLLLMSLVFSAGVALAVIDEQVRGTLLFSLITLFVLFGAFAQDYFTTQSDKIAPAFFDGLLPALRYSRAHSADEEKICITDKVNKPYIYALFSEPTDPNDFLRTVQYVDATTTIGRDVATFGRYIFGLQRCSFDVVNIVIAQEGESIPARFAKKRSFARFDVYVKQ